MAIKKNPVSPRQKMINLMYVVLTAMLALNVSTDVLKGLAVVSDSLERSTSNAEKENLAIYEDGTHTVIDPAICEDCHVCQYVCPRDVIKQQEVPEYIFLQREALGIEEGE